MFRDCVALKDVSYLFYNAQNLDIQLVGEGFKNCPIENVEGMLASSSVFGMIPYKLFYTQNKTINNISKVFAGCYKLGYTRNRKLNIGTAYEYGDTTYLTTWDDAVIDVKGTPVLFHLDFTNFDGTDTWYIDGRDWADINPNLVNTSGYSELTDIFQYDNE
jgi:hypothetical protein